VTCLSSSPSDRRNLEPNNLSSPYRMSNEQDVWHEKQEERDVRDSNRDERESHGLSKRLFRGDEEGISPVPARPSGSGNETEGARMTICSDLK